MVNMIAHLGNIMSPYFFREQDEPRYVLTMFLLIGFAALSDLTCLFLKWDLRRANRHIANTSVADGTMLRFFTA